MFCSLQASPSHCGSLSSLEGTHRQPHVWSVCFRGCDEGTWSHKCAIGSPAETDQVVTQRASLMRSPVFDVPGHRRHRASPPSLRIFDVTVQFHTAKHPGRKDQRTSLHFDPNTSKPLCFRGKNLNFCRLTASRSWGGSQAFLAAVESPFTSASNKPFKVLA